MASADHETANLHGPVIAACAEGMGRRRRAGSAPRSTPRPAGCGVRSPGLAASGASREPGEQLVRVSSARLGACELSVLVWGRSLGRAAVTPGSRACRATACSAVCQEKHRRGYSGPHRLEPVTDFHRDVRPLVNEQAQRPVSMGELATAGPELDSGKYRNTARCHW